MKDFLCLIAIATMFYFYFSEKTKWETILWKVSCSLAPLIIIINILGYWGMPGTIFHVWFWSLPLICILVLIFYFFEQKYILFSLLLISGIFMIGNEIGLIYNNNECIGIIPNKHKEGLEGVSSNLLKNITDKGSLVSLENAYRRISKEPIEKKWIISLPSTPELKPEWLRKNALAGEYYLFAEHNNLNSFIGSNSPFNSDSFHRKTPWDTYKPIMNPYLFKASGKDVLYCSNIGCTLKNDLESFPLVWVYTKFGSPILLAKSVIENGKRFVYIGDSDPIVSFLAPYNPFWIRSLMGMPNYFEMLNAILIFILSFYVLVQKEQKSRLYVFVFLVLSFLIVNKLYTDIKPNVDISINSTEKWLTPHYPSHFSSLPKKLVQENLTVALERNKTISKLDLEIISKKRYRIDRTKNNNKYNFKLLVLLPDSSIITPQGNFILADDVPFGDRLVDIQQHKIIISDARNLYIDGNLTDKAFSISENIYVIATGSPQRIKGIHDLIYK
jgi:hypothetical protein